MNDLEQADPPLPKYIRPSTIAEAMDVSVDTVLRMAREGELEGVQFRGQVRILYSSFQKYMGKNKIQNGHQRTKAVMSEF